MNCWPLQWGTFNKAKGRDEKNTNPLNYMLGGYLYVLLWSSMVFMLCIRGTIFWGICRCVFDFNV